MKQRGFTLLELLIALALMGLLSVLLYSAFNVGVRQWESAEMRFSRIETNLAGRRALQQLLGEAYPRYVSTPEGRGSVAFDGTAETLTFLSLLPAALGSGEFAEMTLAVKDSYLALAWSLPDSDVQHQSRILGDKMQAVEFAYFGRLSGEQVHTWHSTWKEQTHLPQLVRMRWSGAESLSSEGGEIIVRPRIDVDVACVYDPISRACHGR